jgi:putative ABC transport system permease protein
MFADLRLAVRSLVRSPGYTAVVTGTLALGMGAAAALHSNLSGAFQTSRFPDMERLVRIEGVNKDNPYPQPVFLNRFLAYKEQSKSFSSLAASTFDTLNLVVAGEPEGVQVSRVSANYFSVLGIAPALGRAFLPGENEAGRDGVVILSFQLWRDRFGRDTNVVGKTILLNERSYEVIGVLPEDFRGPPTQPTGRVYLPYLIPAVASPQTVFTGIYSVARLKPGVTKEQAQAELRTITVPVSAQQAEWANKVLATVAAVDAVPEFAGSQRYQAMQWIGIGAVSFLYLIACVNAGSLMLVRALARKRDVGVRLALGAGRWDVARPLFAEALVLSAIGIGFSILVAKWMMPALMAIAPGAEDSTFRAITLSWRTLAFLAGLGLLTGLLVASGPAWRTARLNVNEAMKESTQGGGESRRMRRVRGGLVVLEAALAVALLAGTGLMIRTFQRLLDYDPGFQAELRYRVNLQMPREERLNNAERLERYKQVVERLKQVPGVTGVTMTAFFNPTNYNAQKLKIDGRPEAGEIEAQGHLVTPDFLDLIGVPLRAGRPLTALRQGDPVSVVVSETFARNYFPGKNPIGERLELSPREKWEIIGVVGDIRSARIEAKPRFYFPYWQRSGASLSTILVRTATTPGPKFNSEVRRAVYEVEPKFAVTFIQGLDRQLKQEVNAERFIMIILEVLASLALLLAVLGLFAMMSYTVVQRSSEFGIRLTFGATPASIRWLVVSGGLVLAGLGVVAGLGLAWALSRFMRALLYGTDGVDPLVFGLVGLLMLIVALPACWWPARRAGQLDVVKLLRAE